MFCKHIKQRTFVKLKFIFILFGIVAQESKAEVTLTPSSLNVVENNPLTLTCSYSGSLTVETYIMTQSSAQTSVGSLLADCSVFDKLPDPALYKYTCPTNNQLSWSIRKVTRVNEGETWRCLVGFTTIGSEDASFTIAVQVPIQNVTMTSPTGSVVTVQENIETVFVCRTSGGLPAATVRWFRDQTTSNITDDVEITTYATTSISKTNDNLLYVTSVLRYAPQKYENGMKIYCAANNSAETLLSTKQVLLDVQYPPDDSPIIQGDYETYVIIANHTGVLSCSIKGGNPVATLTWNCFNTGSASVIVGTTVTKNVTWTASRNQDRSCTCGSSHPLAESQSVSVKVETLYPPNRPIIKANGINTPRSVDVIEGMSVSLVCESSGKPNPDTYIWIKGETAIKNGKSLAFSSVQKQDDGQYKCKAQNTMTPTAGVKEIGTNISVADINVLFAPTVLQMKNVTTLTGTALNVSCPVIPGNPSLATFRWIRNSDSREWTSKILYLEKSTRADATIYKCEARNRMTPIGSELQYGEDNGIFYLNVLYQTTVTSFYIAHEGQTLVTVNEHGVDIKITCEVDSNPASTIKITFGGEILQEQTNIMALSYTLNDVTCLQAGVYTCEGYNEYGQPSIMNVTLFVRCSPRPLHQFKRNITSILHTPVTLSFTTLAYPEPGPSGFSWHKEDGVRWTPLLSNTDLKISSSGLQTNLSLLNVSQTDYGQYRVTVVNSLGSFAQYMYLKHEEITTQSQILTNRESTVPNQISGNNNVEPDNTAMIVGVTLGIISTVVVVYAIYVTILLKRKSIDKGAGQRNRSTTQTTYVNMGFKSDSIGNQDCTSSSNNTDTFKADKGSSEEQYTSLHLE
ncbi:nephrin-like, partial [Mercenaria mercenaria]|uniref:nephrin-like n=1 Tax=Mercenaria mercenaria TaxID=6596 RepID=UPI00234E6A56